MITNDTPRTIAAVGNFDGVHCGHRFLIQSLVNLAHNLSLEPIVISFETHPKASLSASTSPKTITDVPTRTRLLTKLGVSRVVLLDFAEIRSLSATEFLSRIHSQYRVDAILMGFNNHIGADRLTAADLQTANTPVKIFVATEAPVACSSSSIRAAIANADFSAAATMLGRPFSITGTIIHGRRIGRTIGFPTANIAVDESSLLPPPGVYAADITIAPDSAPRRAVVNIGTNPTVAPNNKISVEAHIIAFNANIYGRTATLTFIARIRNEHKFPSFDALAEQISRDIDFAANLLTANEQTK